MRPTLSQEQDAARVIAEKQLTLEAWLAARPVQAMGSTASVDDVPRLSDQCVRVYRVLRDLSPHTLADISAATGDPQASVSARIRQIRAYLKAGNKGDVKRENLGRGLWQYSLTLHRYFGGA